MVVSGALRKLTVGDGAATWNGACGAVHGAAERSQLHLVERDPLEVGGAPAEVAAPEGGAKPAERAWVRAVALALSERGLDAGRAEVAHIVGRDVRQLDEHGVARAAIESCAENFSDGVVAPVFWYVLFGLPGMLAYKAVNTMDSMLGYRNERYLAFGWAPARLDDVANLLPARLSGMLLSGAAALAPEANAASGFRTMLRDARLHRSPNAGWPEAAMAGALGLSLSGPRRYPGLVVNDPWIGSGTARATARDVARALSLFAIACALNGSIVAVLAAARMATA